MLDSDANDRSVGKCFTVSCRESVTSSTGVKKKWDVQPSCHLLRKVLAASAEMNGKRSGVYSVVGTLNIGLV